jgi:UDP-2,4-diacetamido-2,4,6-trideoxy-beta-L-altropyranose hydrolase
MTRSSILFVCDAGPAVGGGHVMRCLTLAAALAQRGVETAFLASPAVEAVLAAFAPSMRRAEADGGFTALAIDHYGLAADDHRRLAGGRPTLVIDDLANRRLAADLVLDSGPSRTAADYAGLVPDPARLLIGPAYAPVRPQFAQLREAALLRRDEQQPVRRLLVSMGLTDVGGVTAEVLRRLLPGLGGIAVDVAVGGQAPSLPWLLQLAEADERITVHVDTPDMARLTLQADAGIGAGGSTTWERCTLALPTLQVTLAENQRQAAAAVAASGAALVVDGLGPAFDEAAARLLADAALRLRLAQAAARLCDGRGADRVADAVVEMLGAR